VQRALAAGGVSVPLVTVGVSALVLVLALWWLYFLHPAGEGLATHRERSYVWGYGHYGVFAALGAVGAGLSIAVEQTGGHIDVAPVAAGYAIAVPVAVFLVLVWALHSPLLFQPAMRPAVALGGSAVVLLLPLAALEISVVAVVAAIAFTCAAIVAITTTKGSE
jgi:low temperature requirement protein LtrA